MTKKDLYDIKLDGQNVPENYEHVITDLSHKNHLHGPVLSVDNEKFKSDSNNPFSYYSVDTDAPLFYTVKNQQEDLHKKILHTILDAIEISRMDIKGVENMSITQNNTITNNHITATEQRLTTHITTEAESLWSKINNAFTTLTNTISGWVTQILNKIQNHTVIVTEK